MTYNWKYLGEKLSTRVILTLKGFANAFTLTPFSFSVAFTVRSDAFGVAAPVDTETNEFRDYSTECQQHVRQ